MTPARGVAGGRVDLKVQEEHAGQLKTAIPGGWGGCSGSRTGDFRLTDPQNMEA
jgi:hypothetical protein